jgi:hypothetical protein
MEKAINCNIRAFSLIIRIDQGIPNVLPSRDGFGFVLRLVVWQEHQ